MVKKQNLIQLWDNYTSLTSDKNLISFISGRPGQEAFNFAAKRLIKIIANTAKFEIKEIIDYSPVDGLERLKKVLIRKYQTENIFLDPKDNKLKGVNPPENSPLVANAYLTVTGNFDEIINLSKEITSAA